MTFFFIRSQMNDMVIDVEGGNQEPGTYLITWEKKAHDTDNVNQLFYMHEDTGTMRSALNDYCIDVNADNEIVLQPFRHGDDSQRWRIDGDRVCNNDGQVIDISGENEDSGARLCKWHRHDGANQKWSFEFVEPRYFYIRSMMHGKVIDVSGSDTGSGAELIMWPRKDDIEDNQLFTFGPGGVIKSKLSGYVIDSSEGDLKLQPIDPNSQHQRFRKDDHYLRNMADGRMFDINGACEDDGTKICLWEDHGGENQRWELDYVD